MRISGKTSGVSGTQGVGGIKPSSTPKIQVPAPASVGDAIQVSPTAQLMAVAQSTLAIVPDVRVEKVEAIKAQLDAEAYNPDGEEVAEGIIREHMPVPRQA